MGVFTFILRRQTEKNMAIGFNQTKGSAQKAKSKLITLVTRKTTTSD